MTEFLNLACITDSDTLQDTFQEEMNNGDIVLVSEDSLDTFGSFTL